MKKYFYAIIFLCFANDVFAQLAVRNEPRHHNVFENDYVRVLDVYLAPKDTTQFHVHATPSVFIMLTTTTTTAQLTGREPVTSKSVAGSAWYDSLVTPRIHRVWNDDTAWFHVMDVELVAGKSQTNDPVIQNSLMQLLFDAPLVRGYHIQFSTSGSIQLPSSKTGYLLVSPGEAVLSLSLNDITQHRLMKQGHYVWIASGEAAIVSSSNSAFIILQMK